jgi:L-fucose isomerase-like protein
LSELDPAPNELAATGRPKVPGEALVIASGDTRDEANRLGWPAQLELEANLADALAPAGLALRRANRPDPERGHGFITSQRAGMDVFRGIPSDTPVVVASAIWQYSHHVLAGLRSHRGPILTAANWSGTWPGLVGMLNLNASLTKANVPYSTIWSEDFRDDFARQAIAAWATSGHIDHDTSHVRDLAAGRLPQADRALGSELADRLQQEKAILGVFDEGCMGMYSTIIDDEMLNPMGIYKERLSQSALYAAMQETSLEDARRAHRWLVDRGMRFITGEDEATELTQRQIVEQLRMYIAAVRFADRFGCDAIGIQYQQGLKDLTAASDLAEGLLNNPDRPPVFDETGRELFPGLAVPHFNEVDEGSAVDAVITNRVWRALGMDPSTTLHDIRWGDWFDGQFVWVFEISGAVPASHLRGGYAGAVSERQPPLYFPLGGGTLKGVAKPGEFVWSRVFIMGGRLHVDIGRGTALELPDAETERRWAATTSQWPIMHAQLHGITRDQMMARHRANHIQVAYANGVVEADQALATKASMFDALGVDVHLCGRADYLVVSSSPMGEGLR